jgi:UDP-glucose 4-epimerase
MRDFVFVTDVASAFLAAAEAKHIGKIYNLGAGKPQSVNRLVELLGGDVVYIPKRPGEPDCTWADISKIQKYLAWSPKVSFANGLSIMLADINKWQDAPLWDAKSIAEATKTWMQYMAPKV